MGSEIIYPYIDEAQLLAAVMWGAIVGMLISLALAVTLYVVRSIGLYKVAHRRGIKRPWMAWVPLADYWILGSVADHYRRVSLEENRNRRVLLTVLMCTYTAISLLQVIFAVDMVMTLLEYADTMGIYDLEQMVIGYEQRLGAESPVGMLSSLLSLAASIFYYICLHDFYASCRPANKNMYLVLSILIPVTEPFFIFSCRYAELGMPQRDENQQYTRPQKEEEPENALPPAQPSEPPEDTAGGLWKDS